MAPQKATVVDMCCGSGAIGAALAATADIKALYAVDIDPAAVHCAYRNLPGATVLQGDLYGPLAEELRGHIDVLVANVPYVPTTAVGLMPPESRLYEPRFTVDGGPDGLDVLRRMAADAAGWLASGGHLLVEASVAQAPIAENVLRGAGLEPGTVHSDDLDSTVVIASTG